MVMTPLKARSQEAPKAIQFYLPEMPVPLSACFKNVGKSKWGRAPTGRYEKFQRAVVKHIRLLLPMVPEFLGPVKVAYIISRPDKRRRDLDNLLKCLNDTMKEARVFRDDSQIVDLRIGWTLEEMEMPVLVQVEAV